LDADNSGTVTTDEFQNIPELALNPLLQRMVDIFDVDGNGELDFRGN